MHQRTPPKAALSTANFSFDDPRMHVFSILEPFLKKGSFGHFPSMQRSIRLNGFQNLSEPELQYLISRYQSRYASISNISISFSERSFSGDRYVLKGRHETGYGHADHCSIVRGCWEIEFCGKPFAWEVSSIQIEGVEF